MKRRFAPLAALLLIAMLAAGCTSSGNKAGNAGTGAGTGPKLKTKETRPGVASWYGGRWIGRLTANGERYAAADLTAAHKTLPFHTLVRVTNLKNGKSVIVRINNRGPYIRGRSIDLSIEAARSLDMVNTGVAKVQLDILEPIKPSEHFTGANQMMAAMGRTPAKKAGKTQETGKPDARAQADQRPGPARPTPKTRG